jgi:hypothetical protein
MTTRAHCFSAAWSQVTCLESDDCLGWIIKQHGADTPRLRLLNVACKLMMKLNARDETAHLPSTDRHFSKPILFAGFIGTQ